MSFLEAASRWYCWITFAHPSALISPANRDRPSQRSAFTAKCQTYLQQGIGVIVVDVVTTLSANLHNELMQRLDLETSPLNAELYAIAYRIAEIDQMPHLNLWQETLAIGQELPTLPLFLKGRISLPVNLDRTYQTTCQRQRIS
ncbi:hypothetical protein [Leptolyngbya ohadii]|uniref:hypothetical protein n=1 Tax=Leptolyngbya ohadii TaxID=1962290 RepID=UPI0015C62550|nr:hypothetical protein [Leptolyngbya ohadii]